MARQSKRAPRRGIKYANADKSKRLQRVLGVLADGCRHSTLAIIRRARVCAVNSIAAELRMNGHKISCKREGGPANAVWYYQLQRSARA